MTLQERKEAWLLAAAAALAGYRASEAPGASRSASEVAADAAEDAAELLAEMDHYFMGKAK